MNKFNEITKRLKGSQELITDNDLSRSHARMNIEMERARVESFVKNKRSNESASKLYLYGLNH